MLVGQEEVFVEDGGIGFNLEGFTVRQEFEKPEVSLATHFANLIVCEDLVYGSAGIVGGGEVAGAVAEDVAVEDKDKVVFFNEFFPELAAVIFGAGGVVEVRIVALRIFSIGVIVTEVVVVEVGVGEHNAETVVVFLHN